MWVVDRHTLRFLEVNEAAVRQYGYSRGEFKGMTTPQIEAPNGARHSTRHCTQDGALIDVELSSAPTMFQGRAAEIVLAINVTQRHRTEADIQDRERRFRSLFEDSPIAYCEMDASGTIRRVNRAECDLLGLSAEQLLGRPAWDLAVPEKREEWIEFFRDPRSQLPLPNSVEVEYLRPDGVSLTFAVYPQIMEEANSTVAGIRIARLDITELKQAERERAGQRRFEELVSDVTDAFVTYQDLDDSLQYCAEAVVLRLDGVLARIWTPDTAGEILELRASAGVYTALDGPYSRIPAGQTRIGQIALQRQPCLINADSGDPMFDQDWAKQEGIIGFAGYALAVNDETVGVLALFSKKPITDGVFQALGKAALEIAVVVERKSAEKALRDSELRYRRVVETAAEGIWVGDKDGRVTFVNRRMGELLGSKPENVIGKTMFDYVFGEDRELVLRIRESMQRGNREIVDFRLRRTDGSEIWTSVCAAPILDEDGRFAGYLGMFTDITQRKQAEDALRASEEFNKGIVESTGDGILVLDISGQFLYMSPAAKRLLDIEDETHRAAGSWLELWTGANRKKLEDALTRGASGESNSFEGSCSTVKGATRLLEVSVSAIRGRSGDAPRLVAILRDIAMRKQLEGQLTQALKLESIGQLAAGVAHEINTPIQYIGDNARFLQESFLQLQPMLDLSKLPAEHRSDAEFLSEEVPKAAGQLLEGVEHVARIVRAMKEFSHPGPVNKTTIDLNRAIQSTIVVSRNEWKYVAEMIEDFDWELPPVLCMPGEINQVILNLIVNAAHAIGDRVRGSELRGAITVSSRRDGEWVEIHVRDTGTGIPEAARGRVFDPFFTTKEVGKGTGQGLAIAHTVVVKNHGGTIRFESELGVGTTFIVRLPIAGT
jgi:PAS domain S-box-containing protein